MGYKRGNKTGRSVDRNHYDIIKDYRCLGALVLDTSALPECFDILVSFRGRTLQVEIKYVEVQKMHNGSMSEKEKRAYLEKMLTEGERKYMRQLQANGGTYHIVYDTNGVLKSLGLNSKQSTVKLK